MLADAAVMVWWSWLKFKMAFELQLGCCLPHPGHVSQTKPKPFSLVPPSFHIFYCSNASHDESVAALPALLCLAIALQMYSAWSSISMSDNNRTSRSRSAKSDAFFDLV
jgi:hypothetical protein